MMMMIIGATIAIQNLLDAGPNHTLPTLGVQLGQAAFDFDRAQEGDALKIYFKNILNNFKTTLKQPPGSLMLLCSAVHRCFMPDFSLLVSRSRFF